MTSPRVDPPPQADERSMLEAFAAWRDECRRAAEVMAGVGSLDQVATLPRDGRYVSARWILVHMIEEYARHNGHADLLRQRIDGATGE